MSRILLTFLMYYHLVMLKGINNEQRKLWHAALELAALAFASFINDVELWHNARPWLPV